MRFIWLTGFLTIFSQSLSAQSNNFDPDTWVTNGTVNSVVHIGSTVYLGGDFSHVGPLVPYGTSLDASTGLPNTSYPKPNNWIRAVVADGSGGWFVGGDFTSMGGVTRNFLARINSDGTLNDWNPNMDGAVYALTLSGGVLYVGGTFQTVGGSTTRKRIAAFDISTGNLTAWDPIATTGQVNAIVVNGSTVYVGGTFTNIGGQTRNRLAALDATTNTSNATPWNPNIGSSSVTALASSGGILYVGGNFTTVNATTIRNRIAAYDITSGNLTDWNPDANGVVNALIVSGTTVYIGGNFTNVGGASRNRIAALDATLNTSNATSWNPNADNTVNSLMMSGSTVYAGGDFLNIGSEARTKVAALSVSTGLATLWNPKAGGAVLAFSEQSGKIFAGGGFTIIGGHARNRLAAINTNTGEATAWNPDADGLIYSMAINDGSVYVCGTFNTIGGVTRTRVASIDATTGSVNSFAPVIASGDVRALAFSGGLIYIGGTFTSAAGTARNRMAAFNISSGALTSWDPGANNTIRAFGINGETLYVGGDFTTIGGGQTRNRIAAVSLSDGTATSWNPNANDIVLGLLMDNDQIFAGGNFTTIGGQTRNRIAALSISSGLATSWNPNINGSVSAFAMSGGAVFAGRSFTTVGSPSITRNRAAGIFKTSGQLMSWNPNSNGQVNAFDIINDRIYMAGSFTQLGNQPCSYFASFTISSVSWGGSTGGNFSDAANWAPGIAPSSTMDVAIPHGSSILDTDHTIPSTKSLTISGTGSMSLAAGKTLTIAGTADFGGKSVTLMSSAVGTAAIGQVTGTLSNATNVTVERYLPAGRKWRLLGAPLTGGTNNSIFYNWQNNDIPNGSTGVEIWGPEGSADPSSANTGLALGGGSSMRTYNVVWQNVTNTNSSLLFDATTNYGYALFQTGPYNNGSTAYIGSPGNIPAAVSTTLSATGTLITGTHTKTFTAANAGQYFLVANPYASPVDPASFTDAGTINRSNLGNTLYMWDAKPGGTSGLGRYVSYDISAGQYSTFGAGTGYAAHTTPIQSGQAFFVRAINAGAASLTFRESSKGSISSHDMMGDARPVAPSALRFQLLQDSILYDGAVAYFHAGASRSIDQMDGFKLQNGSDNLGLRREGKTLVFEHHPELTVTDTLFLHLGQMRTGAFTLRIEGDGLTVPEGMVVRLVDKRSGQETPIDVRRPTDVSFSIGTDSIGTSDRFMLIFKSKTGSAVQTTESIVSGILKVFPNPIAGIGNVNVTLDKSDAPWQILVTDLLGRAIWQRRQINEQRTEIPMSRFSVGTYHIIATSASGGRIVSELVRQ